MKYIVIFTESTSSAAPDPKPVYEYIESFKHWARLSTSTYVIISDLKPSTIRDNVLALTNHYGEIYVVGMEDKYAVFGPDFLTEIFDYV